MKRLWVCGLVIALMIGACGGGDSDDASDGSNADGPMDLCTPPDPPIENSPTFGAGTAIIETDDDRVMVDLEVADTTEQKQFGLMFRESLPDDCGMVFIEFQDTTVGFWMKDTLIPLSVAFFDEEGVILGIVDMEPCDADPCEIYSIEQPYRGALEANQGAFDEWGVDVGDVIHITH